MRVPVLIIALLAMALPSAAWAYDDPKALVDAIYEPYQRAAAHDDLQVFYSARLKELFTRHGERASLEQVAAEDTFDGAEPLGFNPFIDAQNALLFDVKIGEPVVLGDQALVTVSFHNFDHPSLLSLALVKEGRRLEGRRRHLDGRRARTGCCPGCCSTTRGRVTAWLDRPRRLLQPGLHLALTARPDLLPHPLVVGVEPVALGVGQQLLVDQPQVDRRQRQRLELEEAWRCRSCSRPPAPGSRCGCRSRRPCSSRARCEMIMPGFERQRVARRDADRPLVHRRESAPTPWPVPWL